jgi:hypothetical protein
MSRLFAYAVVIAALVAATTPVRASGVTVDKLAYLTFNAPVQVPGAMLSAGTYRFHLANESTNRDVIQVLSNDGAIAYAMFHTITDRRTTVTEDPVVTFRETPAGVPPAISSLFYGGEHRGYEFLYPKGGPVMVRVFPPQGEIEYTPLPPASAPVPVVEPELDIEEPAPVLEPFPEPVPLTVAQAPPAELPRTATPLPLVAAGGVASLVLGLGVGLLRRRTT